MDQWRLLCKAVASLLKGGFGLLFFWTFLRCSIPKVGRCFKGKVVCFSSKLKFKIESTFKAGCYFCGELLANQLEMATKTIYNRRKLQRKSKVEVHNQTIYKLDMFSNMFGAFKMLHRLADQVMIHQFKRWFSTSTLDIKLAMIA